MKREVFALFLALKDPRTPWYAKGIALATIAYALSPIDLIPDFIPLFGYLDDIIIVPLGIWLCVKVMPKGVMEECRSRASSLEESTRHQQLRDSSLRRFGLATIVCLWTLLLILAVRWVLK